MGKFDTPVIVKTFQFHICKHHKDISIRTPSLLIQV